MPAVLLEAGSIINKDEELKMDRHSAGHRQQWCRGGRGEFVIRDGYPRSALMARCRPHFGSGRNAVRWHLPASTL